MPTIDTPETTDDPALKNGSANGGDGGLELSVVVPVYNEAENILPQVEEIRSALADRGPFEIIYVDDGSSDETPQQLSQACAIAPELRVLRHVDCCGQSTAIVTGIKAARAPIIATLDGDGQNDPADIPRLLDALNGDDDPDHLLIAGLRAKRKDSYVKRVASRFANRIRAGLLGDKTPDTGCGLKVFTQHAFMDMPHFDHLHRYLPALMIRRGGRVMSVPVNHRPRRQGTSKYGVFDRLWVGISDLMGVMWLQHRAMTPVVEETTAPAKNAPQPSPQDGHGPD